MRSDLGEGSPDAMASMDSDHGRCLLSPRDGPRLSMKYSDTPYCNFASGLLVLYQGSKGGRPS